MGRARAMLGETVERLDELSRRMPLDRSAWEDILWACRGSETAEQQKRTEDTLFYMRRTWRPAKRSLASGRRVSH